MLSKFYASVVLITLSIAVQAHAQDIVVALPSERANDFGRALRVEMGGDATLHTIEIARADREGAEALARAEAQALHVSRVAWLEFTGNELRPPALVVDTEPAGTRRTQMLPAAIDVMDARLFALSLVSLLDAPVAEPVRVAPSNPPHEGASEAAPSLAAQEPTSTLARRRVRIATDDAAWSLHVGAELGASTLIDDSATLMKAFTLGLAGYVAGGWRIEGDVHVMFEQGHNASMRGAVGAAHIFGSPTSAFHWLLGGRAVFGFYERDAPVPLAAAQTIPDAHACIGAGVFAGMRQHLGPHFAIEERAGLDLLARFHEDRVAGLVGSATVQLEYVF